MKIYSYRPPRIRPAEFDTPQRYHHYRKLLIPVVILCIVLVGFRYWPDPEMISAVVSDGESLASTADSMRTPSTVDPLLASMRPFLKAPPATWKLQNLQPNQAIGGGPGLLKDALKVKSAVSVNFDTGEVYYSHNAAERMRIASITKVMTAMTAIDLVDLDETFTVGQSATEVEPTVIGVRTGEQLTARELIKAGLLTSGNDAMAVLAEGVGKKYGGDTSLFVAAMNEKAKAMGLKNTSFENPQGYDAANHFSTAEEIVYMARYALQSYPSIAEIVGEKEEFVPATSTHRSFNLPNWNMLINTYPGADGIKIGNTGDAGHTSVASASREGKRIITVVLGADGILERDLSSAELLNVGFNALGIPPFQMTEELLRTRIQDWY
jgi:D-alanyl-D-alanine carboxypeptidase